MMVEKISVDVVIKGGIVLTMEDKGIIENGGVATLGDSILFVGSSKEAAAQFSATTEIDASGCVVMPGLINGHTHAAMTLFRGIADDLPLDQWLNQYIFPAEAQNLSDEFVYWGTKLAILEMLLGGTTTFCDMYLFEDSAARAVNEMKMRGVLGEVLYNFPSPNYGSLEEGFRYTEAFIRKWRGHPLIFPSVQPHSLDTCSPDLLIRSKELADRFGVLLVVHVAESRANVDYVKNHYGKSSFRYLDDLGVLSRRFVADHAVWVDLEEMEIMVEREIKVITNPESNMKLASGWAPIQRYIEKGIVVGLGTDGCASNNNLDLFGEMDTLAKLHKVYGQDPTHMDAFRVLNLATICGARALGLEDRIGTLRAGKKADIIVIDFNKPHLTPLYNPFSHLVYAVLASDIRDVMINGEILVRERKLKQTDQEEILAKAREVSKKIDGIKT